MPPLHYAFETNQTDIARMMLSAGADILSKLNLSTFSKFFIDCALKVTTSFNFIIPVVKVILVT